MIRGGIRIRWLLLGASAVVVCAPVFAAGFLRIYETYLVRQTERQLIAQSVVIAEAYREAWLREQGLSEAPSFRPPTRLDDAFIPIEPVSSLGLFGVDTRQVGDLPMSEEADSLERRVGLQLEPMLRRSQVFNLSAVRILDTKGCVVATSRGEEGRCMAALIEVARALGGTYSSTLRQRVSDEPLPPISDVRSRGSIRIFTALPVFSNGKVVAVVRMSRTSLDALTSLWHARRGLLLTVLAAVVAMLLSSFAFSALIASPVLAMSRRAETIANGGAVESLSTPRWMPFEIRRLGESLDTMTRKLTGRAAYVAELAANVSHELKSPITAIRGAAELLKDSWKDMQPEQRRQFISNIDADAARMERLVARLLELAKIENAVTRAEDDNVNVRKFFEQCKQRFGEQLQVAFHNPPEGIAIAADHLFAAVGNLLENAARASGDKPVWVEVGAQKGRLLVIVRDEGSGISAANQKRLFERFFTTEREAGGTGLGLSIVKAVAEARGGSIGFVTGPQGSSFTLQL